MEKTTKNRMYYNPIYLYLSGRECCALKKYNDGKLLVCFPTFGNEKMIVFPNDLDESKKKECEKKWYNERMRIAKDHGWI